MRPSSPEAVEPHISVIPEGVIIGRGNTIIVQDTNRVFLGTVPVDRFFDVEARLKGSEDTVARRTLGHFQELRHQEGQAVVVHLQGNKAEHNLGYIIEKDDDAPIESKLARAAFDAINGRETLDWADLMKNHALVTQDVRKRVQAALVTSRQKRQLSHPTTWF